MAPIIDERLMSKLCQERSMLIEESRKRSIKLGLDKLLSSLSYTAVNPASLSTLQTWQGCRRFLCQLLPLETLRILAQAQTSGKGREVGERSEWVKTLVRWRSVSNGEKAQSSSRCQRSASLIGDRETCLEFMMINLVSMEATFCFLQALNLMTVRYCPD